MNFTKLAKYFTGKLPNSEKINISDFVNILSNIGIVSEVLKDFENKFGSIPKDYKDLFEKIKRKGDGNIYKILDYFELPKSFVEEVDYSDYIIVPNNELNEIKSKLLLDFTNDLEKIEKITSSKGRGNEFEDLCEKFLLYTSYFVSGFKEFSFEDGTEKIDRLLKLTKDIGNFSKKTNYLGYVILESKFKKYGNSPASEVSQLKNYIERLNEYGISKYTIVITSTDYKETYKEKIGDYCKKQVIKDNPFYLSLLTTNDIIDFLKNEGEYENMSFDEFIERSFIKWLK